MTGIPQLVRTLNGARVSALSLGLPVGADYLAFVGARARLNTWLATAFDLKVFFAGVAQEPAAVTTAAVFTFRQAQRAPRARPAVVRLDDGETGLAGRTMKRRLASLSGLGAYLVARGDAGVTANPLPQGLATRRAPAGPCCARRAPCRASWRPPRRPLGWRPCAPTVTAPWSRPCCWAASAGARC